MYTHILKGRGRAHLGVHDPAGWEGWTRLVIEDSGERKVLDIRVTGRLQEQGLTQLFFEGAEPLFEEFAPEIFFLAFPESTYEIKATTLADSETEPRDTGTSL